MAAPKRSRHFVFILVPEAGVVEVTATRAASAACRVAVLRGLTPICPLLYYLPFMTPEERSTKLPRLSRQWLRRCGKIWLQFPSEAEDLDVFSFDVLQANEDSAVRLSVSQLERCDDNIYAVPMERDEIRRILGCNLSVGLARCA